MPSGNEVVETVVDEKAEKVAAAERVRQETEEERVRQ